MCPLQNSDVVVVMVLKDMTFKKQLGVKDTILLNEIKAFLKEFSDGTVK
jgi:hypothetical protein